MIRALPAVTVAAALIVVGSVGAHAHSAAIPLEGSNIRVLDGDTVRLKGAPRSIRLVGFNAPETSARSAACPAEIEYGKRARTRLRELASRGAVTLSYVACACPAGTENTPACNHGRACGVLRVGSTNVGDILIAEGLAARYVCTATGCPRLPRPWCASHAK